MAESTKTTKKKTKVEPEVKEETVVKAAEPIKGRITNIGRHEKVVVRSSAEVNDSNTIDYVGFGTEVLVFPDESTKDFYKVITAFGAEGFIMRKFVDTF